MESAVWDNRRSFLRRAAIFAAGAVVGLCGVPAPGSAGASSND